MQMLFKNSTHILTRTQGEKFEDMFLVKIANKGTSFNNLRQVAGPGLRLISRLVISGFSTKTPPGDLK